MYARLRALEKIFARELTELAVTEEAEKLADEWRDALENDRPVPDALDFVQRIVRSGFGLSTFARAIGYLDRCFGNRSPLDPGRLLQTLLPWCTYPAHAWPQQAAENRRYEAPRSNLSATLIRYWRGLRSFGGGVWGIPPPDNRPSTSYMPPNG